MKNIKEFFSAHKKAILVSCCIVVSLVLLGTGTVIAAEVIVEKNSIGKSVAEGIVLQDLGLTAEQVQKERTEFEFENGEFVYDVEVTANGVEYEYRIKASDGTVIIKDNKSNYASAPATDLAQSITTEQAKSIALSDAGVSAENATFTKAALDNDDGIVVYDIEFFTADTEYDFEINASTGSVHNKETEKRNQKTSTTDTKKTYIGLDAAKSIVLKHSNLSAFDVSFIKAKLENDDGRYEYDIEFYSGANEYEYTVDAVSGTINEYDIEAAHD